MGKYFLGLNIDKIQKKWFDVSPDKELTTDKKSSNENEMKFLVVDDSFKPSATRKVSIKQGYLNQDKDRTVRIRIQDKEAFITIKGASTIINGIDSRYEYETPVEYMDAQELMKLCTGIIEKDRYFVPYKIDDSEFVIEVDIYKNLKQIKNLITAEIEFSACLDSLDIEKLPEWIGENVTGNSRYYNSNLV